MLLQVQATAFEPQNPTILENKDLTRATGVCVVAGIVKKVNEGTTRFRTNEHILAITFDQDESKGAGNDSFLSVTEEDITCRIPEPFSFAQACSVGLSMATVGRALFQGPGLELFLQGGNNETVLISGGATPLGTMAIQLLKLSGYKPIVTCAVSENELCGWYGAAVCFDVQSLTCGADIRTHTGDSLKFVLDCTNDATSMRLCYGAIGSSGGSYIAVGEVDSAIKYTRRDVSAEWFTAADVVGNHVYAAGTRQFANDLFGFAEKWLREGNIKPHPMTLVGH